MSDDTTFDLTLERIALIRRMVIAWNPAGSGAPIVHPDAPYGSTDRDGDIVNVTGDDDGLDAEHRALGDALGVFLVNAELKPGRYAYHNTLAKLDPSDVSDVFRDAATGITPEHITFDVTAEHLALVPTFRLEWDEARDVPRVDPERPYGARGPVPAAIAAHLGLGADAASEEAATRLVGLHHAMQPTLQIFLRYADLGPGLFRKDATGVWAPV